ncbi:MAG: dihydropteroate synthase [Burkholderiaceae bacterium]
MIWTAGPFKFDLHARALVMGIVNATPDSFSDGGQHADADALIAHGERLLTEGADILDIGGESTRPGAQPVDAAAEWQRIARAVEHFAKQGACVSVDTMKPAVMRQALAAGAAIINDVAGFRAPEAAEAVAGSGCGVIIMHMQGEPRTMQQEPQYDNVVKDVAAFLAQQAQALERAGVAAQRIMLDPGFGFGKTLAHNLALLNHIGTVGGAYPVMAGVSRKSMLGLITGRAVQDRQAASVAAALLAVQQGAHVVRVHDVAATVDALKVWAALQESKQGK